MNIVLATHHLRRWVVYIDIDNYEYEDIYM